MYELLDSIGLLGTAIFFIVLTIGLIFLFRYLFESASKKVLGNKVSVQPGSKKYYGVDTHKYRYVFSNIGLGISLAIIFIALEFPNFNDTGLANLGNLDVEDEEALEIPPTDHPPPPPPKVEVIEIVEVDDDEEIEEEIPEIIEEFDEEAVIEEVEPVVEEVEEKVDEIFTIVEDPAAPIGGLGAFYKYVGKNMKYPNVAKRLGIEGRVIVQFVVGKDGSINDVKVLRGIGGGCDEEAVRVLGKSPAWKPGKQRGKAVKQRMVIPIVFKLK